MSDILQLNPPIFLETPLGPAQAYFVMSWPDAIWYGVFQEETGENWWFPNHQVRLSQNISSYRYKVTDIHVSDEMEESLAPHRSRYKKKGGKKK